MTKQELIWLLIRLVGVYFLAKGILLALELLAGIFLILESGTLQVLGSLIGTYIGSLLRSLALSALGLYLLNGGSFLFRVLNRQPSVS